MKKIGISGLILVLILSLASSLPQGLAQETKPQEQKITTNPPGETPPQEVQKPKLDYMSTFLSRTTSPLGLKEDEELRRLLKQPKFNWTIRAGIRHILN
ncbi:MAG: hypothetical protein ACPLRA_05615 [Candidatus Saccharicenans sp.]